LLVFLISPLAALAGKSITSSGDPETILTLAYYQALGLNPQESLFYVPPTTALGVSLIYGLITVALALVLEKKLNLPENQDINNIRTHLASAYELPFDDSSIDLVYLITVLPEIPDQGKALAEIKRVLKTEGILAVSEFFPDPDYPLSKTTAKQGEKAGFVVEGIYGNIWTYTVRFQKS